MVGQFLERQVEPKKSRLCYRIFAVVAHLNDHSYYLEHRYCCMHKDIHSLHCLRNLEQEIVRLALILSVYGVYIFRKTLPSALETASTKCL